MWLVQVVSIFHSLFFGGESSFIIHIMLTRTTAFKHNQEFCIQNSLFGDDRSRHHCMQITPNVSFEGFFFFWTASEVYSNFNKHFQSSVTSNPRSLVGDDALTWVMICMSVHYKVYQELLVDDDLLRSEK